MSITPLITSPDDDSFDQLVRLLADGAGEVDAEDRWPKTQLELCARYGVFQWFMPREWGGQDWSELDIVRGYLRLSAACLTTTFIITQRTGACRRILESDNDILKRLLLPGLVGGSRFATVGISHLTTSRRHLARPVLRAEERDHAFILDGFSPWVTGARNADSIVLGATLEDGREILVALPTDLQGVSMPEPARLVGLSASDTGEVRCEKVRVGREWLLAGPIENVMRGPGGAKTGGLQTSTLAIGLSSAAITFLETQAANRADLVESAERLRADHTGLQNDLLSLAAGDEVCSNESLRARANSMALRSTQAALAAAKGSGYVIGHPAARWCREALFFLVWSCPQPVVAANLCELAGLSD